VLPLLLLPLLLLPLLLLPLLVAARHQPASPRADGRRKGHNPDEKRHLTSIIAELAALAAC
jgi:hypothetical protein